MSTRDLLADAVSRALATVAARDGLTVDADPDAVHLERPARREHGDWSTNVALVAAKAAGTNPRALAEALAEQLRTDPPVRGSSTSGWRTAG
jgi:arginyl-tRNA synthetase